jgi:O-antigen/teichoic acid export membrane protein
MSDLKDKNNKSEFKEDTLRKRYGFKLLSGFLSYGITIIIQLMVPRSLGPKAYGDFGFMTSFFDNLVGSLDVGSSIWFFTNLSKRNNNKKIIIFYRYVIIVIFLLILVFVIIATSTIIHQKIWLGQSYRVIYFAMLFSMMTWLVMVKNKIIDAYGLTVAAEKGRIIQRIVALAIIVLLFFINRLNLFSFFIYNYFILILLWFIFDLIIRRSSTYTGFSFNLSIIETRNYCRSLFKYSNPLLVFTIISFAVGFLDRWLLQKFGGSIQQGFFTLSFKMGAVYFLFARSLTQLLTREFSIAFGKKDINQMRTMFRRYVPLVYGIIAYFACFVAVQSEKVVHMIGGSEYEGAKTVMIIMAFYPVHQSYGQLSNSVFYATGQTKLYRNIGLVGMLIGLPLIYFLLAPKSMMGLDAGATGLAIKMVFVQFIGVNIGLYFNTKFLSLPFFKFLLHQFGSIGIMVIIALGTRLGIDNVPVFRNNIILSFILSGIIYTILIAVIGNYFPKLFGLDKKTIQKMKTKLVYRIKNGISKIRK